MAGAAVPSEDALNRELVLTDILDYHALDEHSTQANMYAVLRQLEFIENANTRGIFNDNPEVYEKACDQKLLQYRTTTNGLPNFDLAKFMKEHELHSQHVVNRIKAGVNANAQYAQEQRLKEIESQKEKGLLALAVEVGQQTIHLGDMIATNSESLPVTMILPALADFKRSVEKFPQVAKTAELAKIRQWEETLRQMSAQDSLGESQIMELQHDIDKMAMEVQRQ